MTKQLLKQTIESKAFREECPDIRFEGNQLVGTLKIHAQDRVELLDTMFPGKRVRRSHTDGQPTIIRFATHTFEREIYPYQDKVLATYKVNDLGYKLSYDYIEAGIKPIKFKHEQINTVLTIEENNQIVAFYDITLSLSKSKGEVMLNLNLNQIYVMPQYRGSTYWMDLTVAAHSFASLVLYHVAKELPQPYYFDVCVSSDFYSKSDERIANAIVSEIRMMFSLLPSLSINRPAFIGEVVADMGY